MGPSKRVFISKQVEDLSRRVEEWRRTRTSQSSPMPLELWNEAALLSSRHGVYRIASELRLGYSKLKQRTLIDDSPAPPTSHSTAGFVEISGIQNEDCKEGSHMALELTSANGTHLRLRCGGGVQLDVATVIEAFGRGFR